MKYQIFLFDADDTIFNFQASAEKCFLATCKEFGFADDQRDYQTYKTINQKFWDDYALGKREKSKLILARFEVYAARFGVQIDAKKFAASYEDKLAHTCILLPDAEQVLRRLKADGARLYIITNGVTNVQRTRLALSGLGNLFDDVFISDELGITKPHEEFFVKVSNAIPDFDKSKTLIIGDSLVSDVPLAYNNGVDSCWINFHQAPVPSEKRYVYEINSLTEILTITEDK